jgi:hypothetical protein
MLLNHLNYTRQQEMLSPNLCRLRDQISQSPGDAGERVKEFQRRAKPAFKWWGFLMTNTRMLILFACLILRRPLWYFWVELTAFNLLLLYLMRRQERMAQALLRSPALQPVPAAA